jgi:hypothetical protein
VKSGELATDMGTPSPTTMASENGIVRGLLRRPAIIQLILSLIVSYIVSNLIIEQRTLQNINQGCKSTPRNGIDVLSDMKIIEDGTTGKPRKQVLIAVMSAGKYLRTRALDIARTWGKHARDSHSVDVIFIASDEEMDTVEGIKVTSLPGVNDNMYPPQRKSFSIMRHFHDVELDNYDWFMRVDDDLYINIENLRTFLAKLNPKGFIILSFWR